jgi:hypothetical protein
MNIVRLDCRAFLIVEFNKNMMHTNILPDNVLCEPARAILDCLLVLLAAGMLHLYATKRTHRHGPPEMHTPEHVSPYL